MLPTPPFCSFPKLKIPFHFNARSSIHVSNPTPLCGCPSNGLEIRSQSTNKKSEPTVHLHSVLPNPLSCRPRCVNFEPFPQILQMTTALMAATAVALLWTFSEAAAAPCRTFCGNITVDYPFGVQEGCGHPEFRELVYCINNVMMFHVASGSYQVTGIDYAFRQLSLFDPRMSTCASMHRSPGFVLEESRSGYLQPTPDNTLLLLGCSNTSSLFQGFPYKHLPCRNETFGCEAFYDCPSWAGLGHRTKSQKPPPCCAVPFASVGDLNLTHLHCYSYSSSYSSAPVKKQDPGSWSYGVQLSFQLPADSDFCSPCEASRGVCGYSVGGSSNHTQICLCDGWNSTTTCDSGKPNSAGALHSYTTAFFALLFTGMLLRAFSLAVE